MSLRPLSVFLLLFAATVLSGELVVDNRGEIQTMIINFKLSRKQAGEISIQAIDAIKSNDVNILVVSTLEEFDALKAELASRDILPMKAKLTQVPRPARTEEDETEDSDPWMQDFFIAYYDPESKRTRVSFGAEYLERREDNPQLIDSLRKALESLSSRYETQLRDAPPHKKEIYQQLYGGNLIPVGDRHCVIATRSNDDGNGFSEIKNLIGPSDMKALEIQLHGFSVGHSDEAVLVLPDESADKPCNFRVLVSDPSLYLDTLKQAALLRPADLAFDFPTDYAKTFNDYLNKRYRKLCIWNYRKLHGEDPPRKEPGLRGGFVRRVQPFVDSVPDCEKISKGDLYEFLMQDKQLLGLNENVDHNLDAFAESLNAELSKMGDSCEGRVSRVPELFSKQDGGTQSLFPQSINSELFGKTLLSPNPRVHEIRQAFEKQLPDGIRVSFHAAEELNLAHGHIHCSIKTIRSPRTVVPDEALSEH